MTDPTQHDPRADDADELMAALVDAQTALGTLCHLALSVQCPGCDPHGERAERVGAQLLDRFDVDRIDADLLLAEAADARAALLAVLAVAPCPHDGTAL